MLFAVRATDTDLEIFEIQCRSSKRVLLPFPISHSLTDSAVYYTTLFTKFS